MQEETKSLMQEVLKDYTKLSTETKKKHSDIHQLVENAIESLNKYINLLTNNNNNEKEEEIIKVLIECKNVLILPIEQIVKSKTVKLYQNSIIILKKLIEHLLIDKINSSLLTNIMKSIFEKIGEDVQMKLLECCLLCVQNDIFDNENLSSIENLYYIDLKCLTNRKFIDKSSTKLLFNVITNKIIKDNDETNSDILLEILKFFNDVLDGKNKEYNFLSNKKYLIIELFDRIFSKLSLNYLKQNRSINDFLTMNIRDFILKSLNQNNNQNDLFMSIKLIRFLLLLINKFSLCHESIELIFKYLLYGNSNSYNFQRQLGLESFSFFFKNYNLIIYLYENHKELYINTFEVLHKFIMEYPSILQSMIDKEIKNNSNNNNGINDKYLISTKKLIDIDDLFIENDDININNNYIANSKSLQFLVCELFDNIQTSIFDIFENKKIILNKINDKLSIEQNLIKEMLSLKYELIENSLFFLLVKTKDIEFIIKYLKIYENMINIFGSIYLTNIRNDYLNNLSQMILKNINNNNSNNVSNKKHNTINNNENNNLNINNDKYINLFSIKQVFICKTFLNLSKLTDLFDYDSWLIILKTLQQTKKYLIDINIYEEITSDELKDVYKLLKFVKYYTNDAKNDNDDNDNNNENNNDSSEDHKNILISLAKTIDGTFTNCQNFNIGTLKNIYISFAYLAKYDENEHNIYGVQFCLIELLKLITLNIHRIGKIYKEIMKILIDVLTAYKTDNNISKYILNIITVIIITAINKYSTQLQFDKKTDKEEKNSQENVHKDEEETEKWTIEVWQRSTINPLMTIASLNLSNYINEYLLENMFKVGQICGKSIDTFGYSSIFEICSVMLTNNLDKTFEFVRKLLIENSKYLTVYNITTTFTLLASFITNDKKEINHNNVISLSSIELFEIFGDIIGNFQNKQNGDLSFYQILILDEINKNNEKEKYKFHNELWKFIFHNFININYNKKIEIRNQLLKVFTSIFKKHCKEISKIIQEYIVSKIFFKVFEINISKYKEMLNKKTTDYKENEWEENIKFTLDSVTEAINIYFTEDKKLDNDDYKFNDEIFKDYLTKCNEIITICSPDIIIHIVKCIFYNNYQFDNLAIDVNNKNEENKINKNETQNVDNENNNLIMKEKANNELNLIVKYMEIYWLIINNICLYLNGDLFKKKYSSLKQKEESLLYIALNYIKKLFGNKSLFLNAKYDFGNILNKDTVEHIEKNLMSLLNIYNTFDNRIIENNPQKIEKYENDVFNLIDNLCELSKTKDTSNMIYKMLIKFYYFDNKKSHTEALCRRVLVSFQLLFENENFNDKDNIKEFIEKTKKMILSRYDNDTIECLIKNNNKNYTNKEIKLLFNLINEKVILFIEILLQKEILNNDEDFWNCLLSFYQEIFNQSSLRYKTISKQYQEEVMKNSKEMEIDIINMIINKLLLNSLKLKEEYSNKLIELIKIGCNLDYNSISSNSAYINKLSISNLFNICKYKSNDEIKNENENLKNEEQLSKYIEIKIKIAKMCTPILIKKCRDIMKKFLADEIKSGSMPLSRNRFEEIKFVLENIKNFNVYPDFIYLNNPKIINNNPMLQVVSKSFKCHLFFLHPVLSEFIATKDNEIKMIIRDIFKIISQNMGINDNLLDD